MMELIGSILVLLGAVFHFSAGLGMLRMPDAYTRMQAGTKASTLGNTLVLAGLAFYHPGWGLKLLIIVYFVLMTNPVSSHARARAPRALAVRRHDEQLTASAFRWQAIRESMRFATRSRKPGATHDPATFHRHRHRLIRTGLPKPRDQL